MHGIVHATLKEFVVEETEADDWDAVLERSEIEPKLYLQVSHYPDEEVAAIVETVAEIEDREPTAVEREFGRSLAPALLHTFRAHLEADQELPDFLESLEEIYAELAAKDDETAPPELVGTRDGDAVTVTYRSDRDHCAMAYGILEGAVAEFEADATVTETACAHDGDEACTFRVDLGE